LDLVKSINAAQGETALPAKSIETGFKKWWPELEKELQEISKQSAAPPDRKKRTEMDVLEEVLDIVRQLRRDTPRGLTIGPLTAIARAMSSSAAAGRTITLKEALEAAEENQILTAAERLDLLAAARAERLKRLGQLASKKDKKDEEEPEEE
jgi:hypothetical protein